MNFVSLPHPNKFLIVESLDYPNPYDFTTPHRHDYFEVILIENGHGNQLIDFDQQPLLANSVYIVYPGQTHLLKRETANGLVLQFRKDIFEFLHPLHHHQLYFQNPALRFGENEFSQLYEIAQQIRQLNQSENLSPLSIHKSYSYLKILLISLIESESSDKSNTQNSFPSKFLELISQNIFDKRKVADYAEMLAVSQDKLAALCKESFGKTPLKLIHEELLLEIKRQMVLGKLSLKEIAFELQFDSSANFSSFIKTTTGLTPSELQENIRTQLF